MMKAYQIVEIRLCECPKPSARMMGVANWCNMNEAYKPSHNRLNIYLTRNLLVNEVKVYRQLVWSACRNRRLHPTLGTSDVLVVCLSFPSTTTGCTWYLVRWQGLHKDLTQAPFAECVPAR